MKPLKFLFSRPLSISRFASSLTRFFPSSLAEFSFPQPSFPRPNYRALAFLATVLTGFASLCAQVAWQKYLTILVGSETRSISLVVAVFLMGLSAGYYVFGKLTEKKWSRYHLLKIYGYVELATAIYISVFYIYFIFLKSLSFNSPSHFFVDILISVLALFLPTFLMGASLPALTSTLPDKSEEINSIHVKIYGWNTFGAFIGVLVSGFYLLPVFGLDMTLIIAGVINLVSALIFMGNKLEGDIHRQTEFPSIPSQIPNRFYIICAFVTGAIIISFEVLFIRLLNLSVGAGVYNFPIILSLFVGGLALGSLSVKPNKISVRFFIWQILITAALLLALFFISPYWSIWISHIRVSLLSIPSNYIVFKTALYIFIAAVLFPSVFFMGRLLPLTYALLKKTEDNYGAICGRLYFFNTLGTVAGTIVIGYLAFYVFNLDDLFKINLFLLTALSVICAFYEKRGWLTLFSLFLMLSCIILPEWDRTGHHLGYFRSRAPNASHYFQKLFFLPKKYNKGKVLYFNDGPNASVSLIGYKSGKMSPALKTLLPSEYKSVSFVVNGKAIGNSLGDFSTMFLVSSLAYLYAPERELSSAVIGLGTGISAGVLGQLEKTRDVTVLEIAPEVIDNVQRSPSFNFNVMSNPKVKIIAQDGFKYFTKTKKKFDVIVSEPSNPWVVGVENVFSLEFYEMAKSSMSADGILIQWAQTYSIDWTTLKIMFHTLKEVFPYAKLYRIGGGDIAIVASLRPLKKSFSKKRFEEPALLPYHKALGFHEPEDLFLTQIFSERSFSQIASTNRFGRHTLINPKLAYRGDKTFFTGNSVVPEDMGPGHLFEPPDVEQKKNKAFQKYEALSQEKIQKRCIKEISFFCNRLIQASANKKAYVDQSKVPSHRLASYSYLRRRGFILHQPRFLEKLKEEILEKEIKNSQIILSYLNHLVGRNLYQKAQNDLSLFYSKGLLEEGGYNIFQEHIKDIKNKVHL